LQGHEARKYAEEIRSAAIHAAGVVRQLLNIARPGTPQVRLLSLNEAIEAVHGLLCRLMRDNIELQLRLDPKLGLVRLDSTQAQQILLNLVLNARDAMPSGGQIVIETANCEIDILQE
jgi:two-component system, cell cycle sensor histidine kinase and response regulator CckA